MLVADLFVALHKERRLRFAVALLGLEIILYLLYIASNSVLRDQDFIYQIYYTWPQSQIFWDWMFAPLLIALIGNGVIWLLGKRQIGTPLLIAALAVTIAWQV